MHLLLKIFIYFYDYFFGFKKNFVFLFISYVIIHIQTKEEKIYYAFFNDSLVS